MADRDPEQRPDLNSLYDLLASERRRLVLEHLRSSSTAVGLSQLAEFVARETADSGDESPSDQRIARTATALAHVDLPKLEHGGLIQFDREAGTVEQAQDYEYLVPLLEFDEE
jgi:predicted transcriptional regulator